MQGSPRQDPRLRDVVLLAVSVAGLAMCLVTVPRRLVPLLLLVAAVLGVAAGLNLYGFLTGG